MPSPDYSGNMEVKNNIVFLPERATRGSSFQAIETHITKKFSDEIKKWVPDNQNLNTFRKKTNYFYGQITSRIF